MRVLGDRGENVVSYNGKMWKGTKGKERGEKRKAGLFLRWEVEREVVNKTQRYWVSSVSEREIEID